MNSQIILDVNENNFEYEVIAYSQNTPVVVQFWAEWSKACHQIQPTLNDLVLSANGLFRLARVEIDKNPGLPLRYSIRTIPTLIVISNGQLTSELIGEQPAFRIREFLNRITPANPYKLLAEKGLSLLDNRDWTAAEKQFRSILDQDHGFSTALLGLALAILPQGKIDEALIILKALPAGREYARAEKIMPLISAIQQIPNNYESLNDLDASYINSLRLFAKGNFLAALDGMLELLRLDKHYKNGGAHKVVIALLEYFSLDDPMGRDYRSELASILH